MIRTRRLRQNESMRRLVRENFINASDLIYPLFIEEGENIKEPVESMPDVFRYSIDFMDEILREIYESGVSGVIIFGIPKLKDGLASQSYIENGIAQKAIRKIKAEYPQLIVIADVCLCEYTDHGHCGIVCGEEILNDETLPILGEISVSCAKAGADIIAPSDMMDGRVGYIRKVLDEKGFVNTPIMSYSAKYASGYYSPFRQAADSAPSFGDRKTYQMDISNGKEGVREVMADIYEGADIVMIKPALSYLDVVKEVSQKVDVPVAVYNVSGEYSMVKAAALKGWIDERRIVEENLISMKRAGAKIIITYHALDMARWLKEEIR